MFHVPVKSTLWPMNKTAVNAIFLYSVCTSFAVFCCLYSCFPVWIGISCCYKGSNEFSFSKFKLYVIEGVNGRPYYMLLNKVADGTVLHSYFHMSMGFISVGQGI